VGCFPDGESAVMLVRARRRHEQDCRRMVAKYGAIPW
jgi:hypothetical protein